MSSRPPSNTVQVVDPVRPDKAVIAHAAESIKSGGLVIFPTRGLYGIGADVFDAAAIERVFRLKGRPADKPLMALISRFDMLAQLVERIPPMARCFMDRFWPGKMTLIMAGRPDLPAGIFSTAGKVGVRLVGHPVAAALVDAVGGPVTGTSANLSGMGGCSDPGLLAPELVARVNRVLDAGSLAGGAGSTVVDVSGDTPVLLRHGAVPPEAVMAAFHRYCRQHVDNAG